MATILMKFGFVETWDFLLFNKDGTTHSFPFASLLSQSWNKLHNSVAFKLLSHLIEMYQHIQKI